MRRTWAVIAAWMLVTWLAIPNNRIVGDEEIAASQMIDATSLRRKVLCGYQGWFRCPGDPTDEGWRHWSRAPRRISLRRP